MSKFYFYNQNNSFGTFVIDDNLAEFVIIEADDFEQANKKAEEIGIYFDGCSTGADCPCCGERWHEHYDEGDADDEPCIYGAPVAESNFFGKEYRIHYTDGRIEKG